MDKTKVESGITLAKLFFIWALSLGFFFLILYSSNFDFTKTPTILVILFLLSFAIGVLTYIAMMIEALVEIIRNKNKTAIFVLLTGIVAPFLILGVFVWNQLLTPKNNQNDLAPAPTAVDTSTSIPTQAPLPTDKAKKTIKQVNNSETTSNANQAQTEWGKATKNQDGSYSMKVTMDDRMSTATELFNALNNYRSVKGKPSLIWDDNLASYAQERANFICKNGGDSHSGFYDFINNQNGYDKLGYNGLGENLARMKLTGVHLVEWVYAQSPGHEKNQLGSWSHAGVGISEYCSVVIFGGGKM